MDKQQRRKFSPEVRARAVRMVIEHRGDHASQWSAIVSIAAKIGCTAQTLHNWVAQAERDKAVFRADLLRQLSVILETRETTRGLLVNVPDVSFDTDRSTIRPEAREKLAKLAGIILSHPGLALTAEGHTDSTGSPNSVKRHVNLPQSEANPIILKLILN